MAHPIKHFVTITKHRHKVIANCFRAGIPIRGLLHDLSKYSPTEFIPGAKYYLGNRSPNEGEREDYGYSKAWLHHKGRNRHHFEYWTDYDPKDKVYKGIEMPQKFLIEMFCDRVAASKTYNGAKYKDSYPLEYFMRAKRLRGGLLHPKTSDDIEFLLTMLAEKGEKESFKYIRKLRRNKNG